MDRSIDCLRKIDLHHGVLNKRERWLTCFVNWGCIGNKQKHLPYLVIFCTIIIQDKNP